MAVWRWLGRVPSRRPRASRNACASRCCAATRPETLLLCEHDPVVTLGRSANPANVLAPRDEFARRGVEVHAASRGGDVTYHGPGQLVGYPIVRLRGGVVGHLTAMARAIASVLARAGYRRPLAARHAGPVDRLRRRGSVGRKICAFGVHVHRRVAIHGFALNVARRAGWFDLIVPCGLPGVADDVDRRAIGGGPTVPGAARARIARRERARDASSAFAFIPQVDVDRVESRD